MDRAHRSRSSTPMRCLMVTGTVTCRAYIQWTRRRCSKIRSQRATARTAAWTVWNRSATCLGSFMRTAPKCPCCTRSDGQPMLMFISSYPRSSHTRAACAMICASSPPNCTASGLSEGSKSRMRLRYASLMLQLVLHVLHSPQRCIAIDATRANDSAAHSFPMNRIRNDHLREQKGVPADPAEKKAEVPDQNQPPACQVVRRLQVPRRTDRCSPSWVQRTSCAPGAEGLACSCHSSPLALRWQTDGQTGDRQTDRQSCCRPGVSRTPTAVITERPAHRLL